MRYSQMDSTVILWAIFNWTEPLGLFLPEKKKKSAKASVSDALEKKNSLLEKTAQSIIATLNGLEYATALLSFLLVM